MFEKLRTSSGDSESLSHVKPLSPVALVGLASPHRIAARRKRDLRHPAPLCRHRSGDVSEAHAQSVRVHDRSIRCQVVVDGNALKMFVQVDYRCGCFRIVCGSGQRITLVPRENDVRLEQYLGERGNVNASICFRNPQFEVVRAANSHALDIRPKLNTGQRITTYSRVRFLLSGQTHRCDQIPS